MIFYKRFNPSLLSQGQKISSTSLSYKLLISKGVLFTFVLFNFYLLLVCLILLFINNNLYAATTHSVTNLSSSLCTAVAFDAQSAVPYAGTQDNGSYTITDNQQTILLENNAWKAIPFNYTVTANTVLRFSFKSTVEGEEHAIGFDSDLAISDAYRFKLFGTQAIGNAVGDYDNYSNIGNYTTYTIPVGQYYTGGMNYLFFVTDYDLTPVLGDAYFSNIVVFEDENGNGINDECPVPCANNQPLVNLGNPSDTDASGDGYKSNLVINETDSYTNTSGTLQTINFEGFNFFAKHEGDPVTPFIVKVNGDNDFTVVAIGTTRNSTTYSIGENNFNFKDGGASYILNDNETIAIGFLDANADGTGGGISSVIPNNTGTPADEIWYTGGTQGTMSGSVVEGAAPVAGSNTFDLFRSYHFNIDYCVGVAAEEEHCEETCIANAIQRVGSGNANNPQNYQTQEDNVVVTISTDTGEFVYGTVHNFNVTESAAGQGT